MTISSPPPPLVSGMAGHIWLLAFTPKYSTCISYNFFIFCPICLKFSHKFLYTYSFILSIKKNNWKISRFWVANTLKWVITTTTRWPRVSLEEARGRRGYLGESDTKTLAGTNTSPEPQWGGRDKVKRPFRFRWCKASLSA